MKKFNTLFEKKKLDPVGKADADIDNDGDVDSSDDYLHNRRKAIKKSIKKESDDEMTVCPECEGSTENHDPECSKYKSAEKTKMNREAKEIEEIEQINELSKNLLRRYKKKADAQTTDYVSKFDHGGKKPPESSHSTFSKRMKGSGNADDKIKGKYMKVPATDANKNKRVKETKDLETGNVDKALKHDCASHVTSEQWGYGECIPGQHTLEETVEGQAVVTHYDVMFEHGIEFNVPLSELKVIKSANHTHSKKKKESAEVEEGVSSAIKIAKKSGGQMTKAYKKIDKMKKGLGDNPRVQKALAKANEEETQDEGAVKKANKMKKNAMDAARGARHKIDNPVGDKDPEHKTGQQHNKAIGRALRREDVNEGYESVQEVEQEVETTYSNFIEATRAALMQMWENDRSKHYKGATEPESEKDKRKGKGAEDMAADLKADNPDVNDDDEKGHDDASKAGRVTKKSPVRNGDNQKGDTKIVNPVKGA